MDIHALIDDLAYSHDQYLLALQSASTRGHILSSDRSALEILHKKAMLYIGLLQIAAHLEQRVWECDQGLEKLWSEVERINLVYAACLSAQEQDPANPVLEERRTGLYPFKVAFDDLASVRSQLNQAVSALETETMSHAELALNEERIKTLRTTLIDKCTALLEQSYGKV